MIVTLWWTNVAMENIQVYKENSLFLWPCSIARLNYQRSNHFQVNLAILRAHSYGFFLRVLRIPRRMTGIQPLGLFGASTPINDAKLGWMYSTRNMPNDVVNDAQHHGLHMGCMSCTCFRKWFWTPHFFHIDGGVFFEKKNPMECTPLEGYKKIFTKIHSGDP